LYIKNNTQLYKHKRRHAFCGRQDDEEGNSSSKLLNQKLFKIEQKIDYLLNKETPKVSIKDFPKFPKTSQSLLRSILDESTWKRNHMLTTEEGIGINDIIQPGLDNPDHPIGVVALSKDCYFTFEDILVPIVKSYHNRNIKLAKFEKDNYGIVKSLLTNMEALIGKSLRELEISTNRNIEEYLLSGRVSRSDRREIEKRVLQFLKNKESSIFDESGKYLSLEGGQMNASEQNQFFRSCGFLRDWPDGRFIYLNNGVTVLTNEEDHIKAVYSYNSEKKIDIKHIVSYFDLLETLEKDLPISFDDNLGYITSLPSNLGIIIFITQRLSM
jgi:hypothetical protein